MVFGLAKRVIKHLAAGRQATHLTSQASITLKSQHDISGDRVPAYQT